MFYGRTIHMVAFFYERVIVEIVERDQRSIAFIIDAHRCMRSLFTMQCNTSIDERCIDDARVLAMSSEIDATASTTHRYAVPTSSA